MTQKKHFRVYIPRIIGGLLAVVAIYYVVKVIISFSDDKPIRQEKKIQPITLFKPPPPPPPPPKVEKPPEPEIKEKIEEPEPDPEPMPDTPDEAPARDLGLDAEGTAGTDGFGLAARKGGNGLFGGGGSPFAAYGNLVKNEILKCISDNENLRRKNHSGTYKVRIKSDGSFESIEMIKGSSDEEINQHLSNELSKCKKVGEMPPPGMPPAITIKITGRI